MRTYIWPVLLPILFLAYSLPLFLRVYATTQSVIDEEFHLKQGLYFCNKRFDVWDPKITTFPGLYLFSLILNPLNLCTVLGLRLISLLAAVVNVVLLYKIRRRVLCSSQSGLVALDAITIAALPPLYFFSHLYYTDVLALTTVLLFYHYWQQELHLQASVYAAASVLVRQTNIVWIGMICGITALDILCRNYTTDRKLRPSNFSLFNVEFWLHILTSPRLLLRSAWQILRKCFFYIIIILPFIIFVFLNGSIVVGDKRAHEATLHLPQIFYFSIFTLIFGISNSLSKFFGCIQFIRREILSVIFLIGCCILIAKYNTLVHPYLLADNRHYIFYIWNRFYGRFEWFKYIMVPIYVFALALMHFGIRHMRDSFKLMFWIAVLLSLCFQRLLEIRYFLIPYVIFRLNLLPSSRTRWTQWIELAFYIIINAITFYIFFTKEIKWKNFVDPQRIIW